ncbi:MAG TPA: LON peptidase substrate-binding domain-containing protein [Dehalococcoidia bacterium]|jgi:Lon protease-like protein|nr:LON peptidase substrate-binding domain-containing protein [Dehalococcoidia bacterium]
MAGSDLRLFPLQTVLFPGMTLQLNVFEDRYRQLVAECAEASEPFGIVLIRDGEEVGSDATPYEVGTTARIDSLQTDREGRIQLRAKGERRFLIGELHHDRPYLWAEVSYPGDEGTDVPDSLLTQARERYASLLRLRTIASGEYAREVETPANAGKLADTVGAAIAAEPARRQELLETLDVTRRLEMALALMDESLPVMERELQAAMSRRYGDTSRLN